VNYFLKDTDGRFLNQKNDKKIWYKWMELRIHGHARAIDTPTGRIPMFADLNRLFREVLDQEYNRQDYDRQFTLRVNENLAKIGRIEHIYRTQVSDAPDILFQVLDQQRIRLERVQSEYGAYVLPERFLG
jgi:phosphoenolpyruvate carboxykinase (GTP)